MTVNGILMISLVLPMVVQAGQVVLEKGPLLDFREGGKATFLRSVDPQEHVRGMASIGNQTEGVLNARQEFCGHYLDLCATYWQLDRCERALANGRLVVSAAGQAMSDDGYIGGETSTNRLFAFSLWNQAHVAYGLLRFAQTSQDREALSLGLRAADWLMATLGNMSPERLVDKELVGNVGSQHLTAFYAFMLAEAATGDKKYGDFVRRTLDGLERTGMNLLSNPDCLKLQSQKGIEMINAWRGVLLFSKARGDNRCESSCRSYWRSIADTQIRNTGAATNKERFLAGGGAPCILPVGMRPNENCVQCGWLRFTREIFDVSGDVRCAHEMERTLYNHILGSVASDYSDFAYYQGNVGKKAFRKNAIYQCCRYRGFAIMAHLPELVLDDDGTNVTPLVYSPLSYRSDDGLALKISTEYPKTGHIELRAATKVPRKLRLPIPGWCREWTLCINGEKISPFVERGFALVNLGATEEILVQLDFKMEFVRKVHDIGGRRYTEYAYGPLVLVRDTGLGDRFGEPLPDNLRYERKWEGTAFAKFTAVDGEGRTHTLVDYAHACRTNPDVDEFEVFLPLSGPHL
ncbi:MAG: glycoside hydrolase family 127 protein [Kiritimatiellae bacterium]|nr:glycoside hydrolase family 127 protein [Kiritimatiellia bacterium]